MSWEEVDRGLVRIRVPGGWIYRVADGLVNGFTFVPDVENARLENIEAAICHVDERLTEIKDCLERLTIDESSPKE